MPCLNRLCIGKYMNKCTGVQPVQDIGPIFEYSTPLNGIFRGILWIYQNAMNTHFHGFRC